MNESSVLYYQMMEHALPLILGGGLFCLGISFLALCYLSMACYCYVFESEWEKVDGVMRDRLIKCCYFSRDGDGYRSLKILPHLGELSIKNLVPLTGCIVSLTILSILLAIVSFFLLLFPTLGMTLALIFMLLTLMKWIVRGSKKAMTKHVEDLHKKET